MNEAIEQIVKQFKMHAHPEGGYFVETYRSDYQTEINSKSIATVIYFLLPSSEKSSWHRIKNDEFWFFHGGSPITVHTIDSVGDYKATLIGTSLTNGELPQFLVKGGTVFGASVDTENSYSFVSCVVAPGFDFEDFELFSKDQMEQMFPHLKEEIKVLF